MVPHPHSFECETATSHVCQCECHGARHGAVRAALYYAAHPATLAPHGRADRIAHRAQQIEAHGNAPADPSVPAPPPGQGNPRGTRAEQLAERMAAVNAAGTVTATGPRLHDMTDADLADHYTAAVNAGDLNTANLAQTEMWRREADAAQHLPPLPQDLSNVDENSLLDMLTRYGFDPDASQRVWDELTRREQAAHTPAPHSGIPDGPDTSAPLHWRDTDPEQEARIDALMARGYDYVEAYAEVHHLDPETLRQQERASAVDRQAGETLDAAVRRHYDEYVTLAYLAAEEFTRGHMLTKEGEHTRINPRDLFSGNAARARKWASEDLKVWWNDNPRLTYTQFKAQVLGRRADKAAAEMTRLSGNGRDFGV
ncbi:MAG: hypothetical protein EPO06_11590 [Burkholderiaceae bacterium]|nr:MAG: hypothetical protein EPO06_11590 [Burkholderiaceae bacterium]